MMKFDLTANKMLIVNGDIVSIEAGEFETTDKALIEALKGAKDVKESKAKPKKA